MTVRMGRKLAELAVAVIDDAINRDWLDRIRQRRARRAPIRSSLARGHGARSAPTARDAFAVQQYGVATTILGAALRLMRLSFLDTQRILCEVDGRGAAALRGGRGCRRWTTCPASRR